MGTDRAGGSGEPEPDAAPQSAWQDRRRRWRTWLPFLVTPLRRGVLLFAVLLVIEYLVVPELVGASKDLYLLGRVNPGATSSFSVSGAAGRRSWRAKPG